MHRSGMLRGLAAGLIVATLTSGSPTASGAVPGPLVDVQVSTTGLVHRGFVQVEVTYRCSWPDGSVGSLAEVYSVLRQRAGDARETVAERLDRDEFWCDGTAYTVPQWYAADGGGFHGGPSTLTLHVILCSDDGVGGDVCVARDFADSVQLRGSGPIELVFG